MNKYKLTVGLEIHVVLKTKTKMFCGCVNNPDERHPNINVCPVCAGHPGTMPVVNEEAVRKVLVVGRAVGGKLANYSQFDRKNYFYPDLPKGYQISQYKNPLVAGGVLNGVEITRIHLEEDAGGSVHERGCSLINLNRAGSPLMELVTEPVIKTAEDARKFAEELQLVLRYLEASDADMEKGQMRIEANISLSKTEKLGVKVEVKNINSFRAVERAINYEFERQMKALEKGEEIVQETRGWDENKQKTFSQRKKEDAHDYRYFPEPDLPSVELSAISCQLSVILELPQEKRERFEREYGLKKDQMEILIQNKSFADYFEGVASEFLSEVGESRVTEKSKKVLQIAVNYLVTDLQGLMKEKDLSFEELLITSEDFAELIGLISEDKITSRVAKDVLRIMVEKGVNPSVIINDMGLAQTNNESIILEIVDKIINENSSVAEEYKKGKEASLKFLIGQGMKITKGSVNPKILQKLLKERIK